MGMEMNFFDRDEYGIVKLVPAPPRPVAIPTYEGGPKILL